MMASLAAKPGPRMHRLESLWFVDSVVVDPGPQSTGSVVVARGLSCMWDLPGPGIKPMPPALAGRFLPTEPPGKPSACA